MNLLESVLGGIVVLIWGSTEYRMRRIREDLNKKIERQEVSQLIDLKQEAIKVATQDIKNDIEKIEKKIDKLIDLQIKNK